MRRDTHPRIELRPFIAFMAMGLCALGVLYFAMLGLAILEGRMQVVFTDTEENVMTTIAIADAENPDVRGGMRLRFAEDIFVTASDGVSGLTKAAVATIGLLRLLPQITALVLLVPMCFHVGRGQVFSRANTRLVLFAAVVMLAASAFVPLINFYGIPALVNACGGNRIGVSIDTARNGIYFLYGFALLFLSGIFRSGERVREALEEKTVEIRKNA